MRFLLPLLAAVAAGLSLLNYTRAPDTVLTWKLALVAGEFGHWLVLLPLALGAAALFAKNPEWRITTLVLCAVAGVGFLRPAFTAWRMSRTLPARLEAAFGSKPAPVVAVFDPARLFWHPAAPAAAVATEVFARSDAGPLTLDFYAPQRIPVDSRAAVSAARPAACIVVVHGGGWDGGDSAQFVGWNHRWALGWKYRWQTRGHCGWSDGGGHRWDRS